MNKINHIKKHAKKLRKLDPLLKHLESLDLATKSLGYAETFNNFFNKYYSQAESTYTPKMVFTNDIRVGVLEAYRQKIDGSWRRV